MKILSNPGIGYVCSVFVLESSIENCRVDGYGNENENNDCLVEAQFGQCDTTLVVLWAWLIETQLHVSRVLMFVSPGNLSA